VTKYHTSDATDIQIAQRKLFLTQHILMYTK